MTNPNGRFGIHGGQYIPETLMNAVIELEQAYNTYKNDPQFNAELTALFSDYANRPSRLYFAEKMTRDLGGAKIYLKREDLNHTGAHKVNNVLGQALLAKKMGKTRLIAETGAGQHGVATATAAALMNMECVVFMGEEDTKRQALNVYRMRLLGAEVVPVTSGTATLKDAVSEAMREWTNRIDDTHYCLGSVMGPHPFPTIVRDFQAVISKEIKQQISAAKEINPAPPVVVFQMPEKDDHAAYAQHRQQPHQGKIEEAFLCQNPQPEIRIALPVDQPPEPVHVEKTKEDEEPRLPCINLFQFSHRLAVVIGIHPPASS